MSGLTEKAESHICLASYLSQIWCICFGISLSTLPAIQTGNCYQNHSVLPFPMLVVDFNFWCSQCWQTYESFSLQCNSPGHKWQGKYVPEIEPYFDIVSHELIIIILLFPILLYQFILKLFLNIATFCPKHGAKASEFLNYYMYLCII